MKITSFSGLYPNLNFVTETESFFEGVKQEYLKLKESGFFNEFDANSLYVYRISTDARSHTGFIVAVDIEEYLTGNIKKHEATLSAKEQIHVNLVLKNRAFLKPILLTYPSINELHDILNQVTEESQPFLSVEKDVYGQEHSFWVIDQNKNEKIIQLFEENIPVAYIADGHHRTSTTALLYERLAGTPDQQAYRYLMAGFFPSDELEVDEFNRVVEALAELSTSRFMALLSRVCDIKPLSSPEKPQAKHEMTLFINKEWYMLNWRAEILEKYKDDEVILDVNLLNIEILEGIIGIKDIRTDQRVKYIEGPAGLSGLKNMVVRNDHSIGFYMYPVLLEEMMTLADHNQVLPPKSTWFQPRLRNGLIIMDH